MQTISEQLHNIIYSQVSELTSESVDFSLDMPEFEEHGDYSTNVALILSKKLGKSPREIAEQIALEIRNLKLEILDNVEIAGPGFINFTVSNKELFTVVIERLGETHLSFKSLNSNKKIMVEYAHPNTHKEMHIGHMRTLITGEAVSRILEAGGAHVFRANYQGDIGPHVAKALYGIQQLLQEQEKTLDDIEKEDSAFKAHFLGQGYARGSASYDNHKEEIDRINAELYAQKKGVLQDMYIKTRQWSLDYYDEFYAQFYTKFDKLFFESQMADLGSEIVKKHTGSVFKEDNGAIIFPGEAFGLHTRVFITRAGNPTYEGKEMANAYKEYEAFAFDRKIHVVASEQNGYFQVVFKALELIDPEKFKDKQHHLSMGMVQLKDRKMSSRTGDVFTVDSLIDQVRERVEQLFSEGKVEAENRSEVVEKIVIGAIKYSVLKVNTGQDASFDIDTSVSLDGNSGPYLQYTYARTRSVLARGKGNGESVKKETSSFTLHASRLNAEERSLMRQLLYFPEVVIQSADDLQPSHIANYLFNLAQKFNLFYQKHKIIGNEQEEFRLALTAAVGQTIKNGLNILGIQTVEKM